ncbi:MAG: electron transfer flavoprotein subunit beta/FixA family protein [Planctomycetes bacterium]|nr:electron transfer flavoprotein subunit beta/FixA family protein [Planctomycetota bacterium]
MNIIVCIKRVPDTETRVRLADGDKDIDPGGVKYVMSPYDEFALEAALRMKEERGDGEVTVLTLGADSAQETLRAGLAVGADAAVLLKGAVTMDGLATAKTLTAELEGRDAPLILFGVKAADYDQQQVGPMVATLLGRPCASNVTSFELTDGAVLCRREVEGGTEVVELQLPAVVSVTKGEFQLRYASLKGIMAAKKKEIRQVAAPPAVDRQTIMALYVPEKGKQTRMIEGPPAEAAKALIRLLREEARAIEGE